MRADRLLAMLMLLSARGRCTAPQLARELEVSERTVFRDVAALSGAGVPVMAETGRNGGIWLDQAYNTRLTGLTAPEAQALLLSANTQPLNDLQLSDAMRSALRKVSASVAREHWAGADRLRQRLYVDASGWFEGVQPPPHLGVVQSALWRDQALRLTYSRSDGTVSGCDVDPLGLVLKQSTWYLVAACPELRVFRLSRVLQAEAREQMVARPDQFDLAQFWHEWSARFESAHPGYRTIVRIAPSLVQRLPLFLGEYVQPLLAESAPDADGWRRVALPFRSEQIAQGWACALADELEVLAPETLRAALLNISAALLSRYS